MNLEKWKTLSKEDRQKFWEIEENKLQAEKLQVAEMMEKTDEALVEIHKNLSEKLSVEEADTWVTFLKEARQKEIENQTN
jgi:divalent metal cation (Fe/Co/Zn/Cd) transporter